MRDTKSPLLTVFLPSLGGGGAERALLNLSHGFSEKGYRVDLVLQRAEGPYLAQISDEVRLIDLGAKRMALALFPLTSYLRRERPHALLSAMTHTNVIALLARKLSRVNTRIVISERTTLSIASRNAQSLRGRYLHLLAKRIYPWAEAIVAVSRGVANDLRSTLSIPRDRIKVIYNPVVTQELLERAKEPVEHPWFSPGEPPVILSVGRLTLAKNLPMLVAAFALVCKERPARLMILGEGEERPKLESLVQELGLERDVAMPGFVDNPYKYMKRACVFVLVSRWEGLPNALIEALALGTPVVSTDCPSGPREILENGKLGGLVPVGNVELLASAVTKTLVENTRRTTSCGAYTLDTVVKQYLEVLGVS